jgi:hypothetical protein
MDAARRGASIESAITRSNGTDRAPCGSVGESQREGDEIRTRLVAADGNANREPAFLTIL